MLDYISSASISPELYDDEGESELDEETIQ
jgi:hypothetical protein